MQTEIYRLMYLNDLVNSSYMSREMIRSHDAQQRAKQEAILELERKIKEFAEAGNEFARDYQLSLLHRKLQHDHSVDGFFTSAVLMLAKQGSRAAQNWHVFGVAKGQYGFTKDNALARKLRVEYGIFALEERHYNPGVAFDPICGWEIL